jgi:hypothetical protein
MPADFNNELCKWGFECKYLWTVPKHETRTLTEIEFTLGNNMLLVGEPPNLALNTSIARSSYFRR